MNNLILYRHVSFTMKRLQIVNVVISFHANLIVKRWQSVVTTFSLFHKDDIALIEQPMSQENFDFKIVPRHGICKS